MIKSYRSKRRKIYEDISILNSLNPNTYHPNTQFSKQSKNILTNSLIVHSNFNQNKLASSDTEINYNNNLGTHNISSEESTSTIRLSDIQRHSLSNNDNNAPENIYQSTLKSKLANWVLECNVPHTTVNKLLNIFKNEAYLPLSRELPKDCRTLLNINSTKTDNIKIIKPGIYYHFGLEYGIIRHSLKYNLDDVIKVVVGVDGLPLSKSSSSQFWPILAYIHPHSDQVFPIGIYHGNEKPYDSNDFLKYFIDEFKYLVENGITVNYVKKRILLYAFCCDAPAKSYILKVKGHSGFSSCTRCFQTGEYLKNRTCFPYSESIIKKRDHIGYITMVDSNHHINNNGIISNLIEIPNFNMVDTVPLDYMHLTLLGVMRKLIHLWLYKGSVTVRLTSRQVFKLSESLLNLKSSIPNEFSRKPRMIQEVSRWKATELRQFLLYTGPIVLKNLLSDECYNNFLTLHISMRILLTPNQDAKLRNVQKLLNYFVKCFEYIYGTHLISHNVHGLLHIVDDYHNFGALDSCSCFPFENFMKVLKSSLRKHDKPLEQFVRRYKEKCFNECTTVINATEPNYKNIHDLGPILENVTCGPQLLNLKIKNFTIRLKSSADIFILTNKGDIVKILNIAHLTETNEQIIIGFKFRDKDIFYEKPLKSSKINVYTVHNISNNLEYWKVTDIQSKMMVLPFENKYISMPLIHSCD